MSKRKNKSIEDDEPESDGSIIYEETKIRPGEFPERFGVVVGRSGNVLRLFERNMPPEDVWVYLRENTDVLINPHGDQDFRDQFWVERELYPELSKIVPKQGKNRSIMKIDGLKDGNGAYLIHVLGSVDWGPVTS